SVERVVAVIGRQRLAVSSVPACLFQMQVGDDQRCMTGPEQRPVGEQDEGLAGKRKGSGGRHAAAMTRPASRGKRLSSALPVRRGIALPGLAPRATRHVEHDALVGKVYLDA